MDFVSPINPLSNKLEHILVCTYYITKWLEVKPLRNAKKKVIAKFLYEEIFTRYRVPREIVTDQGT